MKDIQELLSDAHERMKKTIEKVRHELAGVRTGRVSPALFERVMVDYYGTQTALNQLAGISIPESRLVLLQPYDQGAMQSIEKAILESDLGLTPSNDGNVIRLVIPELNEERRKELVKVVKGIIEEGKVAIRNIRRDVMHDLRNLKSSGEVSEDDERRSETELQKLTDQEIAQLDDAFSHKEAEILEV